MRLRGKSIAQRKGGCALDLSCFLPISRIARVIGSPSSEINEGLECRSTARSLAAWRGEGMRGSELEQ